MFTHPNGRLTLFGKSEVKYLKGLFGDDFATEEWELDWSFYGYGPFSKWYLGDDDSSLSELRKYYKEPRNLSGAGVVVGDGYVRTTSDFDRDCFFVSVILRNRPELRDKPGAVCHSNNPRGTAEISSTNYPARDYDCFFVEFSAYNSVFHVLSEIFEATGGTPSAGVVANMLVARLATRTAKPNAMDKAPPASAFDVSVVDAPLNSTNEPTASVQQRELDYITRVREHKQRIIDHVLATLARVLETQGNEGHQVQSPPVQNEVVVTPPQSTLNVSPTNVFTPSQPSRRKLAQRNRREK
ncbi:hypothetical protein IFM89_003776 [Coptis chinensis]|uniref:UmuC domain-containing protein n=1 Tax=Coptis chinensis TaxID=261450 RepID=A0A835I7N8_9MAGN|nr:hypothetical protein IFM89_003776 [Coptis chinensis]